MKFLNLIFIISTLFSCSTRENILSEKSEKDLLIEREKVKEDYAKFIAFHASNILQKKTKVRISTRSKKYIKSIFKRIIESNIFFFKDQTIPTVKIIKSRSIFFLSLPSNQLYISKGLLEKYVKHEGLLISLLATELIKMKKNQYPSFELNPNGFKDLSSLIQSLTLDLEVKKEINKWSYLIIKRARYDRRFLLDWIRVKNKNKFDFKFNSVSELDFSAEEASFRKFLLTKRSDRLTHIGQINSSKEFYRFKRELRGLRQ